MVMIKFVLAMPTVLLRLPCAYVCSSGRRHTRFDCDWSSDVCSSDLEGERAAAEARRGPGAAAEVVHRARADLAEERRAGPDLAEAPLAQGAGRNWGHAAREDLAG